MDPAPACAGSLRRLSAQVRSLWSTVDAVVSSIEAARDGVERVLRGEVDQHVLDGTGRVLDVPQRLRERVEQLPQVRRTPACFWHLGLTRFCSPAAELGPVRRRTAQPAEPAGADQAQPAGPGGAAPPPRPAAHRRPSPGAAAAGACAGLTGASEPAANPVPAPGGWFLTPPVGALTRDFCPPARRSPERPFQRSGAASGSWRPAGTGSGGRGWQTPRWLLSSRRST